ncbi:MAG: KH domain-containing protein [Clostridia bacterium]|nr:KH domain-containing protein [Clostridia bacterium]
MGKSVIAEGKTSNEAIKKGLKELGCKLEEVDVKVLENEDKKIFFSILDPRVVKVELIVKDSVVNNKLYNTVETYTKKVSEEDVNICKKAVESFLEIFVKEYGDIKYSTKIKEKAIYVDINGESSSKLIGYRGENISAIQTILGVISNKETDSRVRVIVDVCNYKVKREKALKELAKKLEKTVSRSGKRLVLEPMNAYERKIIHLTLQDSKTVKTHSIGEEPRRKVVIEKK